MSAARMRPTLDLCRVTVAQQMADTTAFASEARGLLEGDPPAGSYLESVNVFAHSRSTVDEQTCALFVQLQTGTSVSKVLWNVRDHAISFEAAINDPRKPTTSLMTLVRGMLEGTLLVAHLLEPVGAADTLARGMADWIDTMEQTLVVANHMPTGVGPDREATRTTITEAYADFARGGFHRVQAGKNPYRSARIQYEGAVAVVDLKVGGKGGLAERFLADELHLYPLASGPAHSKTWYLGGAYQLGDEPGTFATYEQAWVSAIQFGLDVCDLLTRTLASALAMDPTAWLKRLHFRRRVLLASIDGGQFSPMSLTDYRRTADGPKPSGGTSFGV